VRGGVLALAAGLTTGAYLFPRSAVIPTLAFFTWAYLFARAAIVLPGELGLFPKAEDETADAQPEPVEDDEDVYWIGD
jgi:hypothetical protein